MSLLKQRKLPRRKLRLPRVDRTAAAELRLCKLCDLRDWQDPQFLDLAGQIMGDEPIQHRKLWEFTQLVRALRRCGLLNLSSVGLSVAAGYERVLYYLANHIGHIVATDVYGHGVFASGEATSAVLQNPALFAPYPYRNEALTTLYMDGCALAFPDNTFDFAFSLSSLEHFGGPEFARRSLNEMVRVVRPGGLIFVTTDCSLNGYVTDEVFRPIEILKFGNNADVQEIESIDWSLSDETLRYVLDMRKDDLLVHPHINLKHLSSIFTSVSLALKKNASDVTLPDRAKFSKMIEVLRTQPILPLERELPGVLTRLAKKARIARWKLQDLLFVS